MNDEISIEEEGNIAVENKTSLQDIDVEQCNEFEEVSDSADEFQQDESETDEENEVIA